MPTALDALELSEVEELVAAELDADADVDADVPGMVAALTAPKIPTPATAAMEALTVRRWSRLSAWSRAQALA